MIVPSLLFILSLIGMAASWAMPDVFLLAMLCALASGILLALGARRALKDRIDGPKLWIIIDGSNVMYWEDGVPRIDTVRQVVKQLTETGFAASVIFDANAGYLLTGRYMRDAEFGQALRLPTGRVMVVPKGTPADPYILNAARALQAQIVTNDRYRDWAADFPEVSSSGFLIKGGYRNGALWMERTARPDLPAKEKSPAVAARL
jgi:hypothetical protein